MRLVINLAYMINEGYITLDALFEKRKWYKKLVLKQLLRMNTKMKTGSHLFICVWMFMIQN